MIWQGLSNSSQRRKHQLMQTLQIESNLKSRTSESFVSRWPACDMRHGRYDKGCKTFKFNTAMIFVRSLCQLLSLKFSNKCILSSSQPNVLLTSAERRIVHISSDKLFSFNHMANGVCVNCCPSAYLVKTVEQLAYISSEAYEGCTACSVFITA